MNSTYEVKMAKGSIDRYNNSTYTSLNDVYAKHSEKKSNAWEYCRRLMATLNGYGLKVLSYNTFMFTAGFLFTDESTGVVKFMYITPSYDCAVDY